MSYTCTRCGHTWTPRITRRPKCCPACRSYRFDKPLKPNTRRQTPSPQGRKEDEDAND